MDGKGHLKKNTTMTTPQHTLQKHNKMHGGAFLKWFSNKTYEYNKQS